ncbi:hypothetical protein TSOC_014228, partial [Tetrabaena socialis]
MLPAPPRAHRRFRLRPNTKRLDRSTHLHFYQRLLGSGARVADGDLADWYYLPVRLRRTHDSTYLDEALTYVQQTYPWWNRTGGGLRHFAIHTGDLGADEVLSSVRQRAPHMTWLTHWGLTADKVTSGWRKAHNPDRTCINGCNRRGRCLAGFCHCKAGHYGADCALSTGPDGKPVLLAGSGYVTRQKRPWVYIYELPPHLTVW